MIVTDPTTGTSTKNVLPMKSDGMIRYSSTAQSVFDTRAVETRFDCFNLQMGTWRSVPKLVD